MGGSRRPVDSPALFQHLLGRWLLLSFDTAARKVVVPLETSVMLDGELDLEGQARKPSHGNRQLLDVAILHRVFLFDLEWCSKGVELVPQGKHPLLVRRLLQPERMAGTFLISALLFGGLGRRKQLLRLCVEGYNMEACCCCCCCCCRETLPRIPVFFQV